MSVGKSLVALMAICYLAILIIGCTGDQGPVGPPGFPGTEGPPGQNQVVSPVADRTFGILIANSTASDFVGAAKVMLTSDISSVPGSDRVVARRLDKAPVIDGIDGGDAEWGGAAASTITLDSIAGKYNGITSARMRAAYDRQYVYMQIKWTEVAIESFAPTKDINKLMWSYDSASTPAWVRTGGEDMLCLGWQLTTITGWSADGIKSIFDGSVFRTPASGEIADLWVWQSTETYYSGFLGDKVVRYADAAGDASQFDAGTLPAFTLENPASSSNEPTYMRSGSPVDGTSYPLNSYEFTKFDALKKWKNHATIPGYISFIPSGSTADVRSTATYDNGTWTVELRRLRQTGNGDDTVL